MTDLREAKLPVWAQDLLAKERRRADEAEARIAAYAAQVGQSPVWHGSYDNPVYVPAHGLHHRVHFELGEPGEHYTEVQVSIAHDGRLEIQGGHSLVIDLQSSNTFHVRFEETP